LLSLDPYAETFAGQRAAASVEARYGGIVRDACAEARLQRVAARLVQANPGLCRPYVFRLLAAEELNAISLPAGRIYVTFGLYLHIPRDDLLAAVLAHEMAHLAAGDSYRPPCSSAEAALARECLADRAAARYLEAAGYSARALHEVLACMEPALPDGWCAIRQTALAEQIASDNPSRRVMLSTLAD
jgi:predicted Zn-dependent protease